MLMDNYVVVIGGLNLDIAGLSGNVYHEKDSNIGEIDMTVGGVGQNIAKNLVKLDVPTYLLTVYGDDYFGQFLCEECKKNNIYLDYAECILNTKSSTYLYITDDQGDMVTAVNDMKITENITPEFLEKRINFINEASICVIDGNIPKESIEWIANHCTVPIFVDPVSIAKLNRFENILDKIDTFKPNELEASVLTGVKIVDTESAKEAARVLHQKGVTNVFISLGAKGILCSREGGVDCIPILDSHVVSVNGAGDCSTATITWARFQYDNAIPLKRVGMLTQAAASLTVEVADSVSPNLNIKNVIERAKKFSKGV
ncbi:PfkB family carbohydrate kinase [Clostridium estertheticum]|uniref:Carbohydrate kinase n=1 Tax=Clostridium estertheticum subsp. estertheticum TaxID=1552 RepID=A0A1J0GDC6_9CLOT|nr:PfkB family carbohydrate kinase [Clostridium estertheticum]APC39291.1 carbohydrate kinase [Clostridium estertheticum subsp. estertheticum]MBZ9614704.1 PfkB family carbohydrate kinase [Clostridium estertheticum subsp. laramiense]WAG74626.1 PfkB family carbohydrate kinase [Clostridium estertheticum]